MKERQKQLLNAIVEEYIHSAAPIGSKLLEEKHDLGVSSATIRNEMLELDKEGYLIQPHTSAGRIPTEKAFKEYIKNLPEHELNSEVLSWIESAYGAGAKDLNQKIKNVAKAVAEKAEQTIIIGWNKNDTYYTGVSHLFTKPEFADMNFIRTVSEVIDRLDDIMGTMFDKADSKITTLIGSDNSFSNDCTLMVTKFGKKNERLLGLLGPMRMDYKNNISLLQHSQKLLS